MNAIEKLKTGVPGLDLITLGGIPKGRATLVTGRSGTCKSIIALQMASSLGAQGIKTMVVSVEETADDMRTTGGLLGFGIEELEAAGKVILTDLTWHDDGAVIVSGEYDVTAMVHRLEAAVRAQDVKAVVLDSVTALFSPRPDDAVMRAQFFRLIHAFRRLGLTAIVTAEAPHDYGALTTLGVEDFVCDAVLILRNIVDGERRRRSIEVHKYRRSPHYKGEYPCTITSKGVVVFPLDAQTNGKPLPQGERYSSGLKGLDEMMSGGLFRDSIVLVRGPAGSGKTTLAGMYARAGALRGERVVYYGFEEPKPILMRNFGTLGFDMARLEAQGHLSISCRYPEATSPEDLLVNLRDGLERDKPALVVLDSVSSIEHSSSKSAFRHFMVGLAALLREHSRSALFTQTITTTKWDDPAAPYLSTLPDAILLLDYTVDADDLDRTIRVLKMRGSAHATEQRRLVINSEGLHVERLDHAVSARGPKRQSPSQSTT